MNFLRFLCFILLQQPPGLTIRDSRTFRKTEKCDFMFDCDINMTSIFCFLVSLFRERSELEALASSVAAVQSEGGKTTTFQTYLLCQMNK